MENFKGIVSGVINFCRGLIRPTITVGLVAFAVYLGMSIVLLLKAALVAGQLTTEQIMVLTQMVLEFIFTITATAVGYWFAERKSSGGSSTPTS